MKVTWFGLVWCFLCLLALAQAASSSSYYQSIRAKPRTIRGFKNVGLSTARGFGKRSSATSSAQPQSLPSEWVMGELARNPQLARYVVRSFLDSDQDGLLTPQELLRPLNSNNN